MERAPAEVVAKERASLAELEERLAAIDRAGGAAEVARLGRLQRGQPFTLTPDPSPTGRGENSWPPLPPGEGWGEGPRHFGTQPQQVYRGRHLLLDPLRGLKLPRGQLGCQLAVGLADLVDLGLERVKAASSLAA